jgi:uncharacterized membrane protein
MTLPSLIFWAVIIGIFFLIRRFWWWYFGIDRAIAALEAIDASLRQLPAVARHDHQVDRRPARSA